MVKFICCLQVLALDPECLKEVIKTKILIIATDHSTSSPVQAEE